MATSQIVLQGKHTAEQVGLYIAFELGDKQWKLSCSDGRRGPSRYSVGAGDKQAVLGCIGKARARCGLGGHGQVSSVNQGEKSASIKVRKMAGVGGWRT